MPSKLQAYAEMAERTARQITGSHLAWTAFLTTAARLYKYPYNEQLMIYMQRPEATACAEYDFWNEKMGRYVRRFRQERPDEAVRGRRIPACVGILARPFP